MVGHGGHKFEGNRMPLSTMQPSDPPLQWSRGSSSGSTRHTEGGWLTPNAAVCTGGEVEVESLGFC